MQQRNGAETLVQTLLAGKVDLCLANPGTSEMQFVAALDKIDGMRCVLGLFEGVVTGAADGYARMRDKPACTLLHLAPGLGNGLANLHNAKRALVPLVNIVGEHRQGHKETDSPLTGDIEGIAHTMSHWVKTSTSADNIAADAAEAIREASTLPGRIATLILPADTAWTPAKPHGPLDFAPPAPTMPPASRFDAAAKALKSGENVVMVLSGRALRAEPLAFANQIVQRTGATMLAQSANGRMERGAGRAAIARTPVPVDAGVAAFRDARHVILIGAKVPAPLFGYPGKPDYLMQPGANLIELTAPTDDLHATLKELAGRVNALGMAPQLEKERALALPQGGEFTAEVVMRTIAAMMPEHTILVDESITAGRSFFSVSMGAKAHDYLQLTGGAIGGGLPMATGAALACPDRKVINMEGDGSSMYTIQALWTQAREKLNVVTVIFANRGYQVLKSELANVGAKAWGERAERMLTIAQPDINWVKLAEGMGVEAAAVADSGELVKLMRHAMARSGPFLIEARIGR
jgi:acetolactate synthase-1/2/3 large subunit